MNIDYSLTVADLKNPLKGSDLRRAAKEWFIDDINKSINTIQRFEVKRDMIGKKWLHLVGQIYEA